MKYVGWFIVIVFLLGVFACLAFGLEWAGIEWKGFFGPKHAAVDRKIFKETLSYNEGMAQQLAKYHGEYVLAGKDIERKRAVAGVVRQMFAEYDESKIDSPILRGWLTEIKLGRMPGVSLETHPARNKVPTSNLSKYSVY